jgi:transcriptional regulator with XRE-family HTH domain
MVNLIELGAFLKSRRDRMRPADVGLLTGPRRRVPGLRRDEVAQLAGASVDYYTEIERGGAQPSEQMLAALARALRLTLDERNHVYHLAGRALPQPGGSAAHVHPGMLDLLGRLTATPAQVMTDLHVVLVQNRLAATLLGPEPETTGIRASFIYRWFADPAARTRYADEEHDVQSRSFVADLRAAIARRDPSDQEATALVEQLLRRSPEFSELWAQREVAVRRNECKRILHPDVGTIDVNCLHLFSEDGRQRLLWFTPAIGTESVEKLELLSVLGTQDLAPEHP